LRFLKLLFFFYISFYNYNYNYIYYSYSYYYYYYYYYKFLSIFNFNYFILVYPDNIILNSNPFGEGILSIYISDSYNKYSPKISFTIFFIFYFPIFEQWSSKYNINGIGDVINKCLTIISNTLDNNIGSSYKVPVYMIGLLFTSSHISNSMCFTPIANKFNKLSISLIGSFKLLIF